MLTHPHALPAQLASCARAVPMQHFAALFPRGLMTCCFLGTVSSVCYSSTSFSALHLPGHRFVPTPKLCQPRRETDSPVPRTDLGALPGVEFPLPPLLPPAKLELRTFTTCHAFSSSLFKYYLLAAAGSKRRSARVNESSRGGETVLSCSTTQ